MQPRDRAEESVAQTGLLEEEAAPLHRHPWLLLSCQTGKHEQLGDGQTGHRAVY